MQNKQFYKLSGLMCQHYIDSKGISLFDNWTWRVWFPGEKIRHFYPLASRASGTKNPLALMSFSSPLLVFMKKIAGLCAIWLNHWLMIFSPSDPSSVGLAWTFLLQVGILALISKSSAV